MKSEKERMGGRLECAMIEKEASQAKMADDLGVSRSTVHCWCTGKRGIHIDKLKDVCQYLDISADWLIGLSEEGGV